MPFQDHYSLLAARYARARPGYPDQLFDYLAGAVPARDLAWDCGTGNGQAARGLARHFARVHATDASAEQLRQAQPHPRVNYHREAAERVSLGDASVDLVTSAVAVHWFDLDRFYPEVRRVLKPGGVVAVWTYHLPHVSAAVDGVVSYYYSTLLAGHWPELMRYVDQRYATLPFPFDELQPPPFTMGTSWTAGQLAAFLASWSAVPRYQAANGRHPVDEIWEELLAAWGGDGTAREVRWDLHVRVGRVGVRSCISA
jgi:SAM-dependent methyltransferase